MEYVIKRLKEIGTIVAGGTPSTKNNSYWDGNIPWVTPVDLSENKNVYISKGSRNISQLGLKKSSAKLVPTGSIIFSTRAPIGYSAIASNPIAINQGFKAIIPNKNIPSLYIYYLLRFYLSYIKNFGSGATFPEVSTKTFNNLKLNVIVDTKIETIISSILWKYDKLIEINNKKIEILEEQTKELYKEWFVRFRFPGHEKTKFANGIPVGWEIKKLGDFCSITRGISYSSDEIDTSNGIKLVNLKNIKAFGGYNWGEERIYDGSFKKNQLLSPFDLIMGVTDMTQDRRCVGSVALVPSSFSECIFSADLIKITSQINNFFLYFMFKDGGYSKLLSQYANGANVLHLRPISILKIKACLPPNQIIDGFSSVVKPYFLAIESLRKTNHILSIQRGYLLNRLMSGKLEAK